MYQIQSFLYFECSHTSTYQSLYILCPPLHPPCTILNTKAAFSNSYDSLLINRTTKKFLRKGFLFCCTEGYNWLQNPLNTIHLLLILLVKWLMWSMRNLPQHQYLLPPIEVQSQKRTASLKTTSPSLFPNLFFGDYSVF